ncbi:MAG TPA: YIP1 family protein [Paludibacter sp.]|nr:YIP1 family protein [Paludibacter sp.]
MSSKIKNILSSSWGLFTSTAETWEKIAVQNSTVNEVRKNFVYPWIVFCVFIVGISNGIYAQDKHIETGILNAIITGISLFGGYFLTNRICFWYLRKQQNGASTYKASETLVSYSFTCLFALKAITTILPGLFFLQILNVFIAYLVWEGCGAVLKLNEDERGNIVLVFSLVIILVPLLISSVIHFILPNA